MKGLGVRWLCPDCGRVIDRPPYMENGDRYHAYRWERILHEVLALMPTVDNAVDRDSVVRVIG